MFFDLDGEKASALRMEVPIIGYVGANGSGKSLLAVHDCLQSLRAGRRVVSSARLFDPDETELCDDDACTYKMHPNHPRAHPLWSPITSWGDILDAQNCDVLMDEVTGIASSRESRSIPTEVADRLHQLRRDDVVLRWTAPSWGRAEILIREVTQAAVLCKGMRRRRVEGNRVWRASTIVSSRLVDARDLDDLTQAQKLGTAIQPLDTIGKGFQLVSRTEGRSAYLTMDSVSSIPIPRTGSCIRCGGSQTRPRCECGPPARKGVSPAPEAARAASGVDLPMPRRLQDAA